VSKRAIAYVQSRRLADPDAARVFLLLAERTQASSFGDELAPMGLLFADTDLPGLAAEVGINADRFRNVLRQLRDLVPMDVLEHPDGVWEIVYGPGYTDPPSLSARDGETVGFRNVFAMPGWRATARGAGTSRSACQSMRTSMPTSTAIAMILTVPRSYG
jgi:hypothetical protein